jgi:hypothetical protein
MSVPYEDQGIRLIGSMVFIVLLSSPMLPSAAITTKKNFQAKNSSLFKPG